MINEIKVASMEELGQRLNCLPNNYVFRGQANANWGLQSSLERVLGNAWNVEKARMFEAHALNSFKSKYHNYCGGEHRPASKLSWLSIMQHYGGPTRLIDFTTSPYIALFFALETYNPQTPNDFSIFYIDYNSLMQKSIDFVSSKDNKFRETRLSINERQDEIFGDVVDRYTYDVAWISEPNESNARIDRQNGTFLISGSLERRMDEILSLDLYAGVDMMKLRIPPSAFEGAYVALRKMGINAKMIYGDLAGLSKSIRMELLAYA
ncbi:FRG domain-containing protein [Paraburkholderia sp. BL6669N2]|uniref:FRG domain-containing protein n=1 Tax=Paraburkholderia sp. BL6669N2 TaxID=1938807 RepID=UPI000E2845C3|nr:FRG domain-containing protein [Paraburkholderia sp. BL6669N2]REG50881.1 FRG domain-containing protein [Paraburkholderia sp. BL6669N2]